MKPQNQKTESLRSNSRQKYQSTYMQNNLKSRYSYEDLSFQDNKSNSYIDEESRIQIDSEYFGQKDTEPKDQTLNSIEKTQSICINKIKVVDRSLLNNFLKISGLNQTVRQIPVQCFNGQKKVILRKQQISDFFEEPQETVQEKPASSLIFYIVLSYCSQHLGFDPKKIENSSFELFGTKINKDKKQQVLLNTIPISQIFSYEYLSIIRTKRVSEKYDQARYSISEKKQQQLVQIIMPGNRVLFQVFDRNKNGLDIKEKMISICQNIGKITLLYYSSFKQLQNKKKISQMSEKVIEVFQQKVHEYQDSTFRKPTSNQKILSNISLPIKRSTKTQLIESLLVNQTKLYGKLYLYINQTKFKDIYIGGAVGFFLGNRQKIRSLLTLVALKISNKVLHLKFKYRNKNQYVNYQFDSQAKLELVVSYILKIQRIYQHYFKTLV